MQHKCLPSRGTVDPSPQMPAEHLLWGQGLIWARGPVGTRPTWAWLQGSQAGGKGRHQIHGREWRVSGHRSQSTSKERQLGGVAPWLGAQKPPWQSKPKQRDLTHRGLQRGGEGQTPTTDAGETGTRRWGTTGCRPRVCLARRSGDSRLQWGRPRLLPRP